MRWFLLGSEEYLSPVTCDQGPQLLGGNTYPHVAKNSRADAIELLHSLEARSWGWTVFLSFHLWSFRRHEHEACEWEKGTGHADFSMLFYLEGLRQERFWWGSFFSKPHCQIWALPYLLPPFPIISHLGFLATSSLKRTVSDTFSCCDKTLGPSQLTKESV